MGLFVFFVSPLSMLQNQKSTWPSILFKDSFLFVNLLGLERNVSRQAQPAQPSGGSEQLTSGTQGLQEKITGACVHLQGERAAEGPAHSSLQPAHSSLWLAHWGQKAACQGPTRPPLQAILFLTEPIHSVKGQVCRAGLGGCLTLSLLIQVRLSFSVISGESQGRPRSWQNQPGALHPRSKPPGLAPERAPLPVRRPFLLFPTAGWPLCRAPYLRHPGPALQPETLLPDLGHREETAM